VKRAGTPKKQTRDHSILAVENTTDVDC
jgi:hypothetical protein